MFKFKWDMGWGKELGWRFKKKPEVGTGKFRRIYGVDKIGNYVDTDEYFFD